MHFFRHIAHRFPLLLLSVGAVIALLLALGHKGCLEGYNFGCGQYYYTDIPNWQDYFVRLHYVVGHSLWFYVLLFFLWGLLMMRLWQWLDRKL